MVDNTGTKFHDYVNVWDASDFTLLPTGANQTFTLKADATPEPAYVNGIDGPPQFNQTGNALYWDTNPTFRLYDYSTGQMSNELGTGIEVGFDGNNQYVPSLTNFSNASPMVVEEIIDFTGPSNIPGQASTTYYIIKVTGKDSDGNTYTKYISNHSLTADQSYTSKGVDTTPYATGTAGYNSEFTGASAADRTGIRADYFDSPDSPLKTLDNGGDPIGYRTIQAWDAADVTITKGVSGQPGTFKVSDTAVPGVFKTYDNDMYINDGENAYKSVNNDLSQIGVYTPGSSAHDPIDLNIYQAEVGYWLEDSSGERFQVTQISFDNFSGRYVYFTEKAFVPGETYSLVVTDSAPGFATNLAAFDETAFRYTELVRCYTPGTNIVTDKGEVAIETLKKGDLVKTADGALKPILWIDSRRIEKAELEANPALYPVVITAGALGNGLPKRDLVVSRQHRMMIKSDLTKAMLGVSEAMVPAIKLTQMPGIYLDANVDSVEYVHILLDEHDAVIAEGAASETLYLGELVMSAFDEAALTELTAIFPDFGAADFDYRSDYFMPDNKLCKDIVSQHMSSKTPLCEQV